MSSLFLMSSRAVAFGVFLMVVVGMVLLFTLPFSKGQHYDFNPNPLAAIIAAIYPYSISYGAMPIYGIKNFLFFLL